MSGKSRLRLSYRSKQTPSVAMPNNETRTILVKIAIPSEGTTKTLLINTTSLISDLREKLKVKLQASGKWDATEEGYAFFWNKDNDQLWLDDKELVEFRKRPKDWKPVIRTKSAPKAQAMYQHQLDKSVEETASTAAPNTFSIPQQTFNPLYSSTENETIVEREDTDLAFGNTSPTPSTPTTPTPLGVDETFDSFDDILDSLAKTGEMIKRKSVSLDYRNTTTTTRPRKSSNAEALLQNSYFRLQNVQLQGTVEDYAKRLKEVNDIFWKIVNGIDSSSIDAKIIRRLAKKGIQQSTLINTE